MEDRSQLTRRRLLTRGVQMGVGVPTIAWLAAACDSGDDSSETGGAGAASEGAPQRGGRLRVGMATGGPADTLDPNSVVSAIDYARAGNLFDTLAVLTADVTSKLSLAESFEPNRDATEWTIRLRQGVRWHDGKPLTADDVLYTLRRIDSEQLVGANSVALIDLAAMRKLDARSLRLPLKVRVGDLVPYFTLAYMSIVQDGAKDFKKPVGTGPFEFVSWQPGESSTFKGNAQYWEEGKPYVDELIMQSITDPSARLNALLGGSVECCEALTFSQAEAQQASETITVLESRPGPILPITMAADTAPFNDVRVRQAMRLIADRQELVDTAQVGFGTIGNDLYGKGLPFYNDEVPQREQDLDRAASLLKQAGKEELNVTLNATSAFPGQIESATAFAEQAKGAGVTVRINNIPASDFYGERYLKYTFAQSNWITEPIVPWMQQAVAADAPYNETHWNDPRFNRLFEEARGAPDENKREELLLEAQKLLWDEGGYLIWGIYPQLDGLARNVHGATPSPVQTLSNYGFRDYWLS